MNYEDLVKKNSMSVITEIGKLQIIDKDFFENKYYPNVDVQIIGTIDLSKPRIQEVKNKTVERSCIINDFCYMITNTFPKDIFGYYRLGNNEFLRVRNIVNNKKINNTKQCLYKSINFFPKKERSPVVFLEKDYLLCEPAKFGLNNRKLTVSKEVILGLKDIQKAGYKLVILLFENDAEKGSCTFNSFKKYNLIFAINLLLKGIKLDAIYVKNKEYNTLESLMELASNDCFLAAKGSIFLGATEKWTNFTKGSDILPQFVVNSKIRNSESYIKFTTITEAIKSFLSGEYLKKKRKRTVKAKEKTVESIIVKQQIIEQLEMDESGNIDEIVEKYKEEYDEPTEIKETKTVEELIQESKGRVVKENEIKQKEKKEKPRKVCVDEMEFPTKPEKPMHEVNDLEIPF